MMQNFNHLLRNFVSLKEVSHGERKIITAESTLIFSLVMVNHLLLLLLALVILILEILDVYSEDLYFAFIKQEFPDLQLL